MTIKYIYIFILLSFFFNGSLIANQELPAPIEGERHPNKRKTLLLATHIEPPLAYLSDSIITGSNIEVARLLAKKMNVQLRFVQCPFARCLSLLKNGQVDMMVGVKKTSEREQYLNYLSKPYTTRITPVRFYLRRSYSQDIANYDDLKDMSIGVLRGATYFERFDNDSQLNKLEVTTHAQLVDMFLKGRFDTFLGREISIKRHVSKDIYHKDMKLASYIYHKKNDSYIVVSKKSDFNMHVGELSKQLESSIASGEIDQIAKKYIAPNN